MFYYMICGVQGEPETYESCIVVLKGDLQGDFTRGLVKKPPKTLWTRRPKVSGLIVTGTYSGRTVTPSSSQVYQNTSTHSKRVDRICTGTSIGAALSTCLRSPDW